MCVRAYVCVYDFFSTIRSVVLFLCLCCYSAPNTHFRRQQIANEYVFVSEHTLYMNESIGICICFIARTAFMCVSVEWCWEFAVN